MDAGFKCYVVMEAIGRIHGRRGRTFLIRLLRGSREYDVEKTVREFDLVPFRGVFSWLDQQEVEEALADLMENDLACIKDIVSGRYHYPMVDLTEEGRNVLGVLKEDGAGRMKEYIGQIWDRQRKLEISDKGRVLDDFLLDLTDLLRRWADRAFQDMDLTMLLEQMELSAAASGYLETFLYRRTPEKWKNCFRSRYALNQTCQQLRRQMREMLGALPEQEAMMFRCRYDQKDPMYRSVGEILSYYGMMWTDTYTVYKRMISYFGSRGDRARFPFIRSVMAFLDDVAGESFAGDSLFKDTAEVTYELYREGCSVPEIARERGLAVSTIYAHFVRLIPEYHLEPEDVVPEERAARITRAIHTAGESTLRAIREQLPSDYNYGEIKLVLALQKENKAA